MKVSWDDSSQLNGNIKVMFQTTNQNINELVEGYERVCHGHIMAIPVAYRGEKHIMGAYHGIFHEHICDNMGI